MSLMRNNIRQYELRKGIEMLEQLAVKGKNPDKLLASLPNGSREKVFLTKGIEWLAFKQYGIDMRKYLHQGV